ncbi:hypothetical protein GCM10017643_07570 [Ancylobacter dichloromethanicus]|uniref:Uncharacterized protein n=1 Tax=Ancylobacter dichloromethanicus TaxID=518825 RepID=A0A9W6J5D0_9HYPH|nr:hypothetical protein GCM10017643_07570 [Ancylobacter dichloromethanicus]
MAMAATVTRDKDDFETVERAEKKFVRCLAKGRRYPPPGWILQPGDVVNAASAEHT